MTYPIKWPEWEKTPRPAPAVSYPVRRPEQTQTAPRPLPTVSYPIKWDRTGDVR
ncbi:hypothetical protein [Streptomyces sp. NPDC002057]|uniref:hypothetical protein n=1 Tax=Streptomyces sp. NPDC002057 TaxID=3154664 RepID=UPI00332DF65C